MIDFDIPRQQSSIIKVIGVGGGGGNAVNHMFAQKIENVDFIICNTDAQALDSSAIPNKIQLGPHLTQGLGAGANPEVGKQATEESLEEIKRILEVNTKMAFVCAGMGGGTGTGGAPIIARICQELDILTVGIVTTPFSFEGPKRRTQAENGIKELEPHVDTLLVISNDKLRMQHKNLKMREAFGKADDVLATAAKCITDIINSNGQINVDFADVCTVMRKGGVAILGSAVAEGEDRAQQAIENAINSPLLNDNDISGARWILLNVNTGDGDYECGTDEFELINDYVRNRAGENTDVIVGIGVDESLGKELSVTLIATGFAHKDPFEQQKEDAARVPEKDKVLLTLNEVVEKPVVIPIKEVQNPEIAGVADTDPLAPTLSESLISEPQQSEVKQPELELNFTSDAEPAKAQNPIVPEPLQFKYSEKEPLSATSTPASASQRGFLSKPGSIYAARPDIPDDKDHSEEEPFGEEMKIVYRDENKSVPAAPAQAALGSAEDLSEEDRKRRKAEARIQKLRNLSYNFSNNDPNVELDAVPAYVRKNLEMLDGHASNVAENYYSKYTVNKDENDHVNLSKLNTFLEGKRPD